MRKVLICVHPKWCEKIFNGSKTIKERAKDQATRPTMIFALRV